MEEGVIIPANLGRNASRERGHTSSVVPAQAGTQYSRDADDRTDKPRRTGSPAFAGDDSSVWSSTIRRHCEERSDEAIHVSGMPQCELLRFARNDGFRSRHTID